MMADAFKAAGLRVFERGWLSSNNILFEAGPTRESVLVDSGYHSHAAQTLDLVKSALRWRPLDRIINTHLHSDHCGGNHALQRAFNCAIDVPAAETSKVDSWDEAALSYRATGQYCPRFERTGVVERNTELELGAHLWQVIAAPGHDPESIVLYQPELEILISADALWENGFGVVFPEIEGKDAFLDVHRTLETIRNLRVQWIIPGHGAPFGDVAQALDRAQRRVDRFISQPMLHALYAAKVLIKFHMLELTRSSTTSLIEWCVGTEYLKLVHTEYFAAVSFAPWIDSVVQGMVNSGALSSTSGEIINR